MELTNDEKDLIIRVLKRVQMQVTQAPFVLGIISKLEASMPKIEPADPAASAPAQEQPQEEKPKG